jgi:hypothetical protein
MTSAQRFGIRYDRWCGWLLGLLGMGRRWSRAEVASDRVTVVMGWAFRSEIPRSAIASAGPGTARVLGWGVHGWRGSWLVNGSSHGLVELRIDPPVRSRVLGVPVRLRKLWLSLDDPEGFLRTVDPERAATS